MQPNDEPVVRFAPPEAEGLPGVTEVALRPDRVEVRTNGRWVTIWFRDIAERQEGLLARWGGRLVLTSSTGCVLPRAHRSHLRSCEMR